MAAPLLPIAVAVFAGLIVLFQGANKAKAAEAAPVDDAPAPSPKADAPKADAPKKKKTDVTAKAPTGDPGDQGVLAIAAAAKKDWEKAAALSLADYLATGDDAALKTVMAELKKAGVPYTALLAILNDSDVKPTLAKPKTPAPEPPAKPKAEPKPTLSKPTPAPAPTGPTKREQLADAVAEEISATKKGAEDRELVKDYQEEAGLSPVDGLYGPDTAKALWGDDVELPPNPRYWPADFMAAKASYRSFLDSMAKKYPDDAAAIAALKKAVV